MWHTYAKKQKQKTSLLSNSNSTGGCLVFHLATLSINHVFQQPQFCTDTSLPHIDSGPVTCFGQWDVNKCNTAQDLTSACSMRLILIGILLPPCEEAWFSLFEDERNHGERCPAGPAGLAPADPRGECSRMRDPVPPRMTNRSLWEITNHCFLEVVCYVAINNGYVISYNSLHKDFWSIYYMQGTKMCRWAIILRVLWSTYIRTMQIIC